MPCFIHTENKARVHRTQKKRKRKKDSERKTERKTHMVRGLWRLSTEASGNELVCTELKLEFWNRAKRFLLSIPRKILAGHTGTQTFENETQMTSVSHAELHANGRTIQKKKWCKDAGFNRRLSSKNKKRERERKKKGVSRWDKKKREWRRREPSSWVAGGSLSSLNSSFTSSSDPTLPAQRAFK